MKSQDRQKLCSNCDGSISIDAAICPYCGAEQADSSQAPLFKNQSLQDSLTSLYTPPYSQRAASFEPEESEPVKKKSDSFKEVKSEKSSFSGLKTAAMQHNASQAEEETKQNPLFPILLLSLGANLFLIGLLQFFFSQNGFLRLEWDASYWFIYALLSLPLLYLGLKKIK